MNYLSVCSGIEAATVAWHEMGWNPLAFSEIEKFPSQVLAHHYPNTPNLGDMTKFKEWDFGTNRLDLLVGGTPCQSFSIAGLRKGLDDPRGNLALTYVAILDKFRPKWCIWENVPGVLSSGGGRDFASFLTALGQLGYGWSYRVLDAQNFGVAQRRRRVFVVGCFGNWELAAKVLFESESLSGNIKQSRKTKEDIAGKFVPSVANCLQTTSNDYSRADGFNMIAQPTISFDERNIQFFSNQNYKTCPTLTATDNKGAKSVMQPIPIHDQATRFNGLNNGKGNGLGIGKPGDPMPTLDTSSRHAVAFDAYNSSVTGNVTKTLDTGSDYHHVPNVYSRTMAVRRLTEVECERLQGFSDNYTNIKENCPSGARYKALGNSMAVPVMRWIGERINNYERI